MNTILKLMYITGFILVLPLILIIAIPVMIFNGSAEIINLTINTIVKIWREEE